MEPWVVCHTPVLTLQTSWLSCLHANIVNGERKLHELQYAHTCTGKQIAGTITQHLAFSLHAGNIQHRISAVLEREARCLVSVVCGSRQRTANWLIGILKLIDQLEVKYGNHNVRTR